MSEATETAAGEVSPSFSWKSFTEQLSDRITVTSVNSRHELLAVELQSHIGAHVLGDRELVDLVVVLRSTAHLYVDKRSRAMVLDVLRALSVKKAEVFVKAIAGVLDPVVESMQSKAIAHPDAIPTVMAPRFVLLSWINVALPVPVVQLGVEAESLVGDAAWKRLVMLAARLLWGIAPAHSAGGHGTKAQSLSSSALHDVWRMLRGCPVIIAPMLTILTADSSTCANDSSAVLMGNIVSTAVRLPGTEYVQVVEKFKDAIIGYIDRVLLGSKTPVSYSSVAHFKDFVRQFVGEQFEALFKSSISKMLLRSPETGLPACLWLLEVLDKDTVDLSSLYLEVFADTLASNLLKSSNGSVRQSAASLLEFLADTPRKDEDAVKAVEIITKPLTLGRYTQPEQRVAVYQVLESISNGWASSVDILTALLKMTGKETQEAAVGALFKAVGKHVSVVVKRLLEEGESNDHSGKCREALKQFSEAALKGLALPDRSAVVRQGWAADAVGEPLWKAADELNGNTSAWAVEHIHPLLKALAATTEKATSSPLAASVLDAHVGFALALRMATADAKKLEGLVTGTEKSLVLWDKVYHKCVTLRESVWLLRAVQMLFSRGSDDARLARILAWVLCRFPDTSLAATQAALSAVQEMSTISAQRLWALMAPVVLEEMAATSESNSLKQKWTSILRAAVPRQCESVDLLEGMALAASHPAVVRQHGKKGSFWIPLVQQASIDPGELCHERLAGLRQTVRQAMIDNDSESALYEAATNLIKDLVFIGGDSVALRLLEYAHADIDPEALSLVTAEDMQVWQTPAGQLHFDPVAQAQPQQQKGRMSDQAWAEQLEREIALKKGQARKLTKGEQALVDRQRAKEDATRARVEAAFRGLHRGLAVVRAVVAAGGGSACMRALVEIVVERAIVGGRSASERLGGDQVSAALVALGGAADGLEAGLRTPIAVGILRARGFSQVVGTDWTRESMEDLMTRVFFRLRVACEARALAPAGFNFLLPLLQATAEAGGWGRIERRGVEEHDEYAQMDHAAEQLTMAVDILGFHAHFGAEQDMPRREVIELLIKLMAEQPMVLAASRAGLLRFAEAMEGSDTPAEREALIAGLTRADSAVRSACLAALDWADLTEMDYAAPLWLNVGGTGSVALDENAQAARALWAENGMEISRDLIADLVPYLRDASAEIRSCAARAIALAVAEEEEDRSLVGEALALLQKAYAEWYVSLEPEYDRFGLVVPGTQHRVDIAEARVAVALALQHLAPLLAEPGHVRSLVDFLVHGRVLGERSEAVRGAMLAAGAQAVAAHGAQWSDAVLPVLEAFLADARKDDNDFIREGVVVLLGRLAQHLPPGDSGDARVADAVDRLVAALPTPAEAVQSAVAECLPPLAKRISDEHFARVVAAIVASALSGDSYSQRRGGAYGLAGMIKGRGLAALKKLLIIDQLREA
ncbi:translational activator of GCN4, partial [Coemansia aciculifera]